MEKYTLAFTGGSFTNVPIATDLSWEEAQLAHGRYNAMVKDPRNRYLILNSQGQEVSLRDNDNLMTVTT